MNYFNTRRAAMNQDEFDTKFNYLKSARNRRHSDSLQQEFCFLCPFKLNTGRPSPVSEDEFTERQSRKQKVLGKLNSYFPIIDSLLSYSPSEQLTDDLCAGVCLGLYAVAQGLTCAFLAGLPPVCGLITACISSLLYSLFGTSTHSYLNTNLILSFFLRNILDRFSTPHDSLYTDHATKSTSKMQLGANQIDYSVSLTFISSIFMVILFASRIRFLFSFVSKHLLSGFCFGLTIRILLSQVNHFLHVKGGHKCLSELSFTMALLYAKASPEKITKCSLTSQNDSILADDNPHSDKLQEISKTDCLETMFDCLDHLNLYTLAIFICALLAIVFVRQLLSPFLQLRNHLSVPFEIFLIIIAALLSYLFDINEVYDVEISKYISSGFRWSTPRFYLIRPLFFDAFALALLSHAQHLQISNEIAKEQKYRVDDRQETIALISTGFISSFLSGQPSGQSQNQNRISINAGSTSMITKLTVFLILLPMIIWAQSLFSYIPVCVFSAIIFNNAGEYLKEIKSITYLWYISRIDVSIFIFSALFTCFSSDSSIALFLSIGFGLFTVICRSQWPKFQNLVNVTGSGIYYAEQNCYNSSCLLDEPGIAIVRFEASLLFHNTARFCAHVRNASNEIKGQLLGVGIGSRAGSMKSNITLTTATGKDIPMRSTLLMSGDMVPNYEIISVDQAMLRVIIVDFSSTPVVDTTGLSIMRELFGELAEQKTRLLFACVNSTIRHRFKISGGFDLVPKHYFFPSVQDAVLAAQQMGGGQIAPNFHMSVSLNGCRDLITLSNAPSNQDFIMQQQHFGESRPETSQRMSIIESRFTPPLTIKHFP